MPDNRLRRVVDGLSTDSMACAKLRCMNISMPPAASRRLRTVRAITALALAATLGGCATYDYVGSDSPGGYYRGQSRSTYPGYYGGSPDGYYDGYYGYPGGYYMPGYYYGGVYYYGGHRYYRPPPHRPDGDHDGGHDRPPPSGNPGGSRMPSPWRGTALASTSSIATTVHRRARMACRRASHRNRRCARRSHPARRRPAASLRDRRSCPASIVPRSTGRSREPRRACFSLDVAVNLPGRDRLRQFWPRSDHVSPCRCPVGNSGSPLFRPLPDVGAQTHGKPGPEPGFPFWLDTGKKRAGKRMGPTTLRSPTPVLPRHARGRPLFQFRQRPMDVAPRRVQWSYPHEPCQL